MDCESTPPRSYFSRLVDDFDYPHSHMKTNVPTTLLRCLQPATLHNTASYAHIADKVHSMEIAHIDCNPIMDLFAIVSTKGNVTLSSMTGKKIWVKKCTPKLGSVLCTCWSPDGQLLSISYTQSTVIVVHVENAKQLHLQTFNTGVTIHRIMWTEFAPHDIEENKPEDKFTIEDEEENTAGENLPDIEIDGKKNKVENKESGPSSLSEMLYDGSSIDRSIMLLIDNRGTITIQLDALLTIAVIQLHKFDKQYFGVSTAFSWDYSYLYTSHTNTEGQLILNIFNTHNITNDSILDFAHTSYQIQYILQYIDQVIQVVTDSWEDILMELDEKFLEFAKLRHGIDESSVADDLICLLLLGTASPELEQFLLYNLSDKIIKNASTFLNNTYKTIVGIVSVNLRCATDYLVFHLSNISSHFAKGNESEAWKEALSKAGSLSLKVAELLSKLDLSGKSVGLFLRWLHRATLVLANETMPADLQALSLEETFTVEEFITSTFSHMPLENNEEHAKLFTIEGVAQFFNKQDMQIRHTQEDDESMKLNLPSLFEHRPEKSLVGIVQELKKACAFAKDSNPRQFPVKLLSSLDVQFEAPYLKQVMFIQCNESELLLLATSGISTHMNSLHVQKLHKGQFNNVETNSKFCNDYNIRDLCWVNNDLVVAIGHKIKKGQSVTKNSWLLYICIKSSSIVGSFELPESLGVSPRLFSGYGRRAVIVSSCNTKFKTYHLKLPGADEHTSFE